jgi:hypothetical protein
LEGWFQQIVERNARLIGQCRDVFKKLFNFRILTSRQRRGMS